MNDRTVIRPGGRRPRNQKSDRDSNARADKSNRNKINLASLAKEQAGQQHRGSSLFRRFQYQPDTSPSLVEENNPILALVSPLILLVSKAKIAAANVDLRELKEHAQQEIEYYRSINFAMDAPFDAYEQVSYGLCCLLDEIVLNTPWGAKSEWSTQSLLVIFHKEAWGGERFFNQLDDMCANPSHYMAAIEFYYCALELGFEGKYRQAADGIREHQIVKNNTYLLIEKYKVLETQALSGKWEGSYDRRQALLKVLPQWVVWSITGGLLLVIYFSFSLLLSYQSDPVKRRLVSLLDKNIVNVAPYNIESLGSLFTAQPDLQDTSDGIYELLLAEFESELAAGKLIIEENEKGVSVRLTDANLFASGSDALALDYVDIMKQMGMSLTGQRVRIEITGHSDDIPIRTLRFNDNWALSEARASAVKSIISENLDANVQVFARGLADTVNLVPNTSSANRALNRRVEVLIRS
ncbi:type IVB secretion system protein IcmH/DotU [Ningiella sp. W23]|uniref:type IVB secretion system protein IcmH/DotU n=1 Tax=Ningiella sp. W23 TaxID=3023715 RepID=UPI00375691B9